MVSKRRLPRSAFQARASWPAYAGSGCLREGLLLQRPEVKENTDPAGVTARSRGKLEEADGLLPSDEAGAL